VSPVNQPRRHGSYVPLSAHYYKDDRIASVGEKAELLYVRGLAFCADVLSDGFITDSQLLRFVGVGMRDATARAKALVDAGLWERVASDGLWSDGRGCGYRVMRWEKWNRSKKEIDEKLAADAARKEEAIAARRKARQEVQANADN
jgi:hypothetical protein